MKIWNRTILRADYSHRAQRGLGPGLKTNITVPGFGEGREHFYLTNMSAWSKVNGQGTMKLKFQIDAKSEDLFNQGWHDLLTLFEEAPSDDVFEFESDRGFVSHQSYRRFLKFGFYPTRSTREDFSQAALRIYANYLDTLGIARLEARGVERLRETYHFVDDQWVRAIEVLEQQFGLRDTLNEAGLPTECY